MRLVLAPYVAIIIVIFFGGTFTFIQLTNLQAQAALAFFSGFWWCSFCRASPKEAMTSLDSGGPTTVTDPPRSPDGSIWTERKTSS